MPYIYASGDWPRFRWNAEAIADTLGDVRHRQGRLVGRMGALGFPLQAEAVLRTLTEDVVGSSEIEGEFLDRALVRSSIARRLGIDIGGLAPADRNVEGVVEMMLDATQRYDRPLTRRRLFDWHAALLPTGRSGMHKIIVGGWRDDRSGPMQVVSGPLGHERVHYQAPPANGVDRQMKAFLKGYASKLATDPVLRAAIAHLWFVTVHPFEDGNGRIARAIADMSLARSEQSPRRFYSMSAQLRAERDDYYDVLERTQKGDLDITGWLQWFLECLGRAVANAETVLEAVLAKDRFWSGLAGTPLNDRQRKLVGMLLDGFEGKLTSSKWATIAKCSQDTALRDIDGLLQKGILVKQAGGGRSTGYALAPR